MSRASQPNSLLARSCRTLLRLAGWQLDTSRQPANISYILIGYPHTSNWDFVLAMLARGAIAQHFHWVAKHSIFRWPVAGLLRAMGGISLDRDNSRGFTDAIARRLRDNPGMVIGLMPEGTRSYRPYWRSGFYHLARSAKVPVVLAYIDARHRRIGFGPLLTPSGNIEQDLQIIRDFYRDIRGIHPAKAGDIAFRPPQ